MAAVVLTGLLALFISGEDWGARAQVDAVKAKNQLAIAQAEKLGPNRITAPMALRAPTYLGFGDAAGPESTGQGSGSGAALPPSMRASGPVLIGPSSQQAGAPPHGPTTTASGKRIILLPDPKGSQRSTQRGNADSNQTDAIEAASRQRSGRPG